MMSAAWLAPRLASVAAVRGTPRASRGGDELADCRLMGLFAIGHIIIIIVITIINKMLFIRLSAPANMYSSDVSRLLVSSCCPWGLVAIAHCVPAKVYSSDVSGTPRD